MNVYEPCMRFRLSVTVKQVGEVRRMIRKFLRTNYYGDTEFSFRFVGGPPTFGFNDVSHLWTASVCVEAWTV